MPPSPAPRAEPVPLGATAGSDGVAFAVFSRHASAIHVCLFDGVRETDRVALSPDGPDGIWQGHVGGIGPGQLYGLRADGPYEPVAGHRFNVNKLLVDPYARALSGTLAYDDSIYGYTRGDPAGERGFDTRDSAAFVPKAVVAATRSHAPACHRRPRRPWTETVIYEAHVKGLSRLHPGVPEAIAGTYEALGHPAIIEHLVQTGVTALELLPIQAIGTEPSVAARGLVNYWGYATLGFLAPEPRYFGPHGAEGLRAAITALHEAGIEVILDVVYNHTPEGEEDGPTLSLRGLDNATYYKHRPDDPGRLWDTTGTGNTLDLAAAPMRRLALDSLRHWAVEYGVDGFRFDLAPALARNPLEFDPQAAFLTEIARDPVLADLKLIAEPWDVGEGGYRLGGFPAGWSEWNDRHRDAVRAFWRGDPGQVARLAQGLSGSREVFGANGRSPAASINYVSSHDGFTLRDIVSYAAKHNEANGEGNRDGQGDNLSANGGQEGDTDDSAIRALRSRQVRNMLATIFLSQGVPMLLAGDELSRTQGGNNNAYCQDNPTSWIDWTAGHDHDPGLPAFAAALAGLRRRFAALRRSAFLDGTPVAPGGAKDVYWLAPDGREMEAADWGRADLHGLGMQIGNDAPDGERLLLLLNAGEAPATFRLPDEVPGAGWRVALDTGLPDGAREGAGQGPDGDGTFVLAPRSVVLFHSS